MRFERLLFPQDSRQLLARLQAPDLKLRIDYAEFTQPPTHAIRAAAQAAAINAAQLLKRDKDLASVTQGKYADVVAIDGNPLADISLIKQVSFVMKGKWLCDVRFSGIKIT